MAQVLAVPGDVRHGFSFKGHFNHDFGRITGIAATIKGNILLCDYDKKNLILVDPLGKFLKKLNLDSEPYDIAITSQNIGYITLPKSRSVLQIDPDRMVELFHATCNELSTTVFCLSAVPNTGRDYSDKVPCFFGVNKHGLMYAVPVNYEKINFNIYSIPERLNLVTSTADIIECEIKGGQSYIKYKESWTRPDKTYNFATMDTPTDICSDDHGHIYVSAQGSNNIHRLVLESKRIQIKTVDGIPFYRDDQEYKVLDIPLHTHHGIKEPVAVCFNKDYSKLYIVNDWGKSVWVFDVI